MINLQVKYFPGNFETNNMVMFSSDILASLLTGYLVKIFRTKVVFAIFFGLQIFGGLSILFLIDPVNPGFLFPIIVAITRMGV